MYDGLGLAQQTLSDELTISSHKRSIFVGKKN